MRALIMSSAVALAVGCTSPAGTCGPSNCNTCCKDDTTCVTAVSDQACGSAGNFCGACMSGFVCSGGSCIRGSTGGGAGGGSAGAGGGTAGSGGAGGSSGGTGGSTGGGSGGAGGTGGGSITCPPMAQPAPVPISFPPTCSVPSPCNGGALAGVYTYTAACVGQDELAPFKSRLEGVCGPGSVNIYGYDGGLGGFAYFAQNQLCRSVNGSVTVSATVSGFCASGCGALTTGISMAGYSGSCIADGGVCDCTATRAISISNTAVAYTTGSNTLTIASTGQTFQTCVNGTMVATHEIDAGSGGLQAHEPGVATLTHQ